MTYLVISIGILSSAALVMSGLSTQRKRMLIFSIITSLLTGIQYSLTESTFALIVCGIGVIRGFTALTALKYPTFGKWYFLALFLASVTAVFILTTNWNTLTFIDTLPLIGSYIGTAALFFKKMIHTKMLLIICGGIWLTYEFHVGIYGQMVGEGFTIIANSIALTSLLIAARRGVPENEVDNVDTHIIDVITTNIPIITDKVRTSSIPVIRTITQSMPIIKMPTASMPIIDMDEKER